MYIVVSYDVPEDKRRTKIHKVLKSYGQSTTPTNRIRGIVAA